VTVNGETKMIINLPDHGLPLVALKEQRRDLIMSLLGHYGPIARDAIQEIAAIQSAIMAMETVVVDLDEEACPLRFLNETSPVFGLPS
jgi:hypothetical protein